MREVADNVWQFPSTPENSINVYLLGDVLIDAGTLFDKRRLFRQLEGREIAAHAITHAHIDHFGASKAVCERFGVELWVGADDVASVESGTMVMNMPGLGRRNVPVAPGAKVARALKEGDTVGGFTVLDTPGHSPGHVSYWRESDGVLVCGDVMWGHHPFLLRGDVREPYTAFSPDAELNRRSARRLAELEPSVIMFGHGPVLYDTERFIRAVERLPS